MEFGVFAWVMDQLVGWQQRRRKVRVLVHQAAFLRPGRQPAMTTVRGDPVLFWFVKVTNLSASRDVEITHLWVEGNPMVVPQIPQRPLPARLRPDETWEGWVPATAVNHVRDAARAVRVQLSTGRVLRSRPNTKVPPVGSVAGPGSR